MAIVKGEKPPRPEEPQISDSHWDFIQRCWLPFERRLFRPSADDAVAYCSTSMDSLFDSELEYTCHSVLII